MHIVKYSSLVHMVEKLVRPIRHMKSCRIFHNIHSITYRYYMHNIEIPRFPNKLNVIITSGSKDLLSLRKYFLVAGSSFPMQSVYINAGTLSHAVVLFMTSRQSVSEDVNVQNARR